MSSLDQSITALNSRVSAMAALFQGARSSGLLYAAAGNFCVYGCKVTQGLSGTDMTLALEGSAAGDPHVNPDAISSPARVEDYPNFAMVYGEGFLSANVNANALLPIDSSLILVNAPTDTGRGRYDMVYVYVGASGPGTGILTGTATTGAFTDFASNGIRKGAYPDAFDPAGLPHGAMVVARVYVQTGDTGIGNARIWDLRNFIGRIQSSVQQAVIAVTGTAISVNFNQAFRWVITTTGPCTITLPPAAPGQSGEIDVINGGGHSVSFNGGTNLRWPSAVSPTVTTTAGHRDCFAFKSNDSTNTIGRVTGQNYFG
jgi:hypothetical protein